MRKSLSIAADHLPQYDELYVISDLHLGGRNGFQIFNAAAELGHLADVVCSRAKDKQVALLINGDLVDFLAEKPALAFDPHGAVDKLERIVGDPAFAPVWKALQKIAATKNRWLIINLGNHDLELALPWVRARLLDLLAGRDEKARGRIMLTFEGAGFLCRVGKAEVLCVHGNEVDTWNVTDYERLRRIGRDMVQSRPVDSWTPNAGSQLVVEVMNDIKETYPFVDLLKPEMQAVIPTLLALDPNQRIKVKAIAATLTRRIVDKARRITGFLSAEGQAEIEQQVLPPDLLTTTQPDELTGVARRGGTAYKEALLKAAEAQFLQGVDPLSLVPADARGEYLGLSDALISLVSGSEPHEVLRRALEKLQHDRSFDLTDDDTTFRDLDELIGNGPDFLIAGHTHLRRALPRRKGRGWYFNSGTWVRLIRLDANVLKDADEFKNVFDVFGARDMQKLDDFPNLVQRQLTVVVIWADGERTHGELQEVQKTTSETYQLVSVEKSRFTRH
ncbi:hypothetical protein GCM10023187_55250 [Nibrella viscosa]|uniref:Calcineurin-like phosphoesterase domain-containing protein n=1 Tax=Nibrella viscosa TaxID=1084524 RepID=A0ABP8L0J2_9BACT